MAGDNIQLTVRTRSDTNDAIDIFLFDRVWRTTELVSVTSWQGETGGGHTYYFKRPCN